MTLSPDAPSLPAFLLVITYVSLGLGFAAMLARRGERGGILASALIVWPALLPMVFGTVRAAPTAGGPYADRIDDAFVALKAVCSDPAADAIDWEEDLTALRATLHRADARIALVDRLLDGSGGSPAAGRLSAARDAAADQIESVVQDVVQLRLQIGLVALAGEVEPVRELLSQLVARATALEEVSNGAVPWAATLREEGSAPAAHQA